MRVILSIRQRRWYELSGEYVVENTSWVSGPRPDLAFGGFGGCQVLATASRLRRPEVAWTQYTPIRSLCDGHLVEVAGMPVRAVGSRQSLHRGTEVRVLVNPVVRHRFP